MLRFQAVQADWPGLENRLRRSALGDGEGWRASWLSTLSLALTVGRSEAEPSLISSLEL
jgi:hypothetical protein